MRSVIGTPPLGWGALVLVAAAHGAGLWAVADKGVDAPPRPVESRFALAVAMAAPRPEPAPAAVPQPPAPAVPAIVAPAIVTTAPAPVQAVAPKPAVRPKPKPKPVETPKPKAQPAAEAPAVVAATVSPAAAPVAPAALQAPATADAEATLTPPSFAADYLDNPRPAYPRLSRRLGEQGMVWLLVRVDADGRPESVEVERLSGHARLDAAALAAVRGWRFVPARRAGRAVAAEVRVPIKFALENDG